MSSWAEYIQLHILCYCVHKCLCAVEWRSFGLCPCTLLWLFLPVWVCVTLWIHEGIASKYKHLYYCYTLQRIFSLVPSRYNYKLKKGGNYKLLLLNNRRGTVTVSRSFLHLSFFFLFLLPFFRLKTILEASVSLCTSLAVPAWSWLVITYLVSWVLSVTTSESMVADVSLDAMLFPPAVTCS